MHDERNLEVTSGSQPDGDKSSSNVARVITAQALDAIIRAATGTNAERNLMDGPPVRVAILHECDKAATVAEIHGNADDIFYVLDGSAVVILGGTLDAPEEMTPGEWRGPGITGGDEREVGPGDLILIPRGTPHMRHTKGRTATLLLVKVTTSVEETEP